MDESESGTQTAISMSKKRVGLVARHYVIGDIPNPYLPKLKTVKFYLFEHWLLKISRFSDLG